MLGSREPASIIDTIGRETPDSRARSEIVHPASSRIARNVIRAMMSRGATIVQGRTRAGGRHARRRALRLSIVLVTRSDRVHSLITGAQRSGPKAPPAMSNTTTHCTLGGPDFTIEVNDGNAYMTLVVRGIQYMIYTARGEVLVNSSRVSLGVMPGTTRAFPSFAAAQSKIKALSGVSFAELEAA